MAHLRVFEEVDPASILTPTSALVMALRTLGVPIPVSDAPNRPPFPWHEQIREEVEGRIVRKFIWRLQDTKAADGTDVKTLIARWNDSAWLAKHPASELAVLRQGLMNAVTIAAAVKATIPRDRFARGNIEVLIPANASPEERAHWLGKLDGTVPPGEVFREQLRVES